jgi:quercetin dioxygenase-like cupin family protein
MTSYGLTQGRDMATLETITQFDLNAEIERFLPDVPSGRRSETLIKTPHLRVVLITMRAGTELHEHVAPGPITVQPIRGRFVFTAGDDEREIVPGTLISVEGGVRHAVRALEDGAFLLTIGWSGGDAPVG